MLLLVQNYKQAYYIFAFLIKWRHVVTSPLPKRITEISCNLLNRDIFQTRDTLQPSLQGTKDFRNF